jgi:hypothetical protein
MTDENLAFQFDKKNDRLIISDSEKFIKMLSFDVKNEDGSTGAGINSLEHYEALKKFGAKQLHSSAGDIPFSEYEYIINFAIAKTVKDFDPSFETNILSFFWGKLRGELSAYRFKRERLQDRINKLVEEGDGTCSYEYQNDGNDNNELILIDNQTLEEKFIEDDTHYRQMKALKMALKGIPRDLQVILFEIGNGNTVKTVSNILHLSELEVFRKRNQGLSLVLQRVLRSKHLTDDEKLEITGLHDIYVEDPFSTSL